jgi:hypothetical protein
LKGPPQLSTFARSDSESFSDAASNVVKKKEEEEGEKSSLEIKKSDSPPAKKDDDEEEEESGDTAGFSGFLQLLQAMSGGSMQLPSANGGDSDGIQNLLARLGIVTRKFH